MSFERIQRLLKDYNISPNKLLGQNFMIEPAFYPKLSNYANLQRTDVVLDAGAGFGLLTRFLSDKCRSVIAVEKDPKIAYILKEEFRSLSNVIVVEGDVLKVELPQFNKIVAAPPYYLSIQLVLWLLERGVDCAVLIVQKEFAERLVATVGSEEYSWITVVLQQQAEVQLLDAVSKDMFYPPPEIESIILRVKPLVTKPFQITDTAGFIRLTKWLFTQRNKKLVKALTPFICNNYNLTKQAAERLATTMPFHDKRPRELSPKDFGAIANALLQ